MDNKRSPFPIRDFLGRIQTRRNLAGDVGVTTLLAENLEMVIGILAVASEMELTPEWQGMRMKMLSQAKADQKFAANMLANKAAGRYES